MLETAIVAARLAGQRAMEELRYVRSTIKNQNEMVTQADPICQKIIMDRIKETYPDDGFIAEEGLNGKQLKYPPRGSGTWWIIDPIDGTNNYGNGILCFSVSVAAVVDGKPVVGVIFDPATESMYTAALEGEAQLNGSRIQVSDQEIGRFSSFGIDSHTDPTCSEGTGQIISRTRFRCLGSTALHMAYVAKGSMIGMAAAKVRLWDIAAGILIIEQAGGKIALLNGSPMLPIQPEQYEGQEYCILASNEKSYPKLLDLFRKKGR
jgi:myo-inositol-1(or 4)-monophosphatase